MADDNKQPANNIASNVVVAALLLMTGTAVYFQPAPLQGARPPVTGMAIRQNGAKEHIDARLWQDPFGAIAKWHREQLAKDKSDKLEGKTPHCADQQCESPLLLATPNTGVEKTLILAVTVSGSPYADNEEWRRRARYAVVSALGLGGFAPQDSEKIGYWRPVASQPNVASQPKVAEPEPKPEADRSKAPLRRYAGPAAINETGRSIAAPAAAARRNAAIGAGPANGGATRSVDACAPELDPWADSAVPFEWFDSEGSNQRVLLLWVNDDLLGEQPLCHFSQLVGRLKLDKANNPDNPLHKFETKFIGPETSGALRAMVNECVQKQTAKITNKEQWDHLTDDELGKKATFYAYSPTAEDKEVLGPGGAASVRDSLKGCIDLYRTIATDDVLADGIVHELKSRGVNPKDNRCPPGAKCGADTQHVVLISEWDTIYGRKFPETMQRAFLCERRKDQGEKPQCEEPKKDSRKPEWLHKFSYLRGLDGRTAEESDRKVVEISSAPSEKQSGILERFTAQTDAKDDAKLSERPDGQRQYDYLRRMTHELAALNAQLQAQNEGRITAIGIVGTDVYDKLLVLRALREKFPGTLFFTTDLDAALTMPSERNWTRNLIVASSFDLELHRDLQSDIPPFRSNYETSAFLSAILAIRDFKESPSGDLQSKLKHDWLEKALIFEATRTGSALPLSKRDEASPQAPPCGDTNGKPADPMKCNAIHPFYPPLYHLPPESSSRYTGAMIFAVVVLLLAMLIVFRDVQKAALPVVLVAALVGILATIGSVWWRDIAELLTEKGAGEPLTLDGTSVWPTIILRILGILLSFGLLWQAYRRESENLRNVACRLALPEPSLAIETMAKRDGRRPTREQFKLMFLYRLEEDQPEQANRNNEPFDLEKAWLNYVYSGRLTARFARVALFVIGMSTLYFLLSKIFAEQGVSARSDIVRMIYCAVTVLDVISLQFLIFFVLDVTCLSLSLVRKLSERTNWQGKARAGYAAELGLERFTEPHLMPLPGDDKIVSVIDAWVDLAFIEQRTRCIDQLIIYPFAVIALLLVSRSTLFANQGPDAPLLITTAISLIVAFGCALALPHAAEKARDFAKRGITTEIIRSNGFEDGRLSGQLKALLDRVNGLREGAFSPFYDQPVVRALLLPLSTIGGTALLEFLALPGV